jgi:hypothetical protein
MGKNYQERATHASVGGYRAKRQKRTSGHDMSLMGKSCLALPQVRVALDQRRRWRLAEVLLDDPSAMAQGDVPLGVF